MTDHPPEIDRLGFDTQESKDQKYWLLRCRACRLTWYLPKAPGTPHQARPGHSRRPRRQPRHATAAQRRRRMSERTIFTLRIAGKPGAAGVRALRFLLKRLLRQYHFVCLDLREDVAPELRRDVRDDHGT
jgi:hypothetical protein